MESDKPQVLLQIFAIIKENKKQIQYLSQATRDLLPWCKILPNITELFPKEDFYEACLDKTVSCLTISWVLKESLLFVSSFQRDFPETFLSDKSTWLQI